MCLSSPHPVLSPSRSSLTRDGMRSVSCATLSASVDVLRALLAVSTIRTASTSCLQHAASDASRTREHTHTRTRRHTPRQHGASDASRTRVAHTRTRRHTPRQHGASDASRTRVTHARTRRHTPRQHGASDGSHPRRRSHTNTATHAARTVSAATG